MSTQLDALRNRLSSLTFAQVINTVAKDSNLISFNFEGHVYTNVELAFGMPPDNSEFEVAKSRAQANKWAWERLAREYTFYFGFAADSAGQSIHFDSKGQSRESHYAGLGIHTYQNRLCPLTRNAWIVGTVTKTRSGLHFHRWAACTEQEKLFVDLLLSKRTTLTAQERSGLITPNSETSSDQNRLLYMAMLILEGNIDEFLKQRKMQGVGIDGSVGPLCREFGLEEVWKRYVDGALYGVDPSERQYSSWIPEPAPEKIRDSVELTSFRRPTDKSVGLSSPFAGLKLSQ